MSESPCLALPASLARSVFLTRLLDVLADGIGGTNLDHGTERGLGIQGISKHVFLSIDQHIHLETPSLWLSLSLSLFLCLSLPR